MRTIWKLLLTLCRGTWRVLNFIRECILNLFVLLVFFVGFGIYLQLQPKQPESGAGKNALLVNLSGVIVDNPSPNNKFNELGKNLLGSSSDYLRENSLFDLVETLRQAKNDANITGMVLALDDFVGADLPSLQYVGKALSEFRASGKPIYATGNNYNQSQYYLASFANNIYLSPTGVVQIQGMSSNTLYYKTLLDKLKVSTHIFRVGIYKSAVEPYMRDDMSPEAREENQRWIDVLWGHYLDTVATNRKITQQQLYPEPAELLNLLTASRGNQAQYAKDNQLVDMLASDAEVEQIFSKVFGWNKNEQKFNYISIYDYSAQGKTKPDDNNRVAVIFASGVIVDGAQSPGMVGSEMTATEIRQARLDPKVKAVILRVNSPGGSVTASEVIRNELLALRQANKPLIISMGGMAASGGYWISTPANYIIASPTTLTGSIGIFGVVNTFEKTLDSIGVFADGVATSPLADVNLAKALSPEFKQIMQLSIENGYQRFVSIVAESRGKTSEQTEHIAQGRVWTGFDAKQNGLIDQLGDFDDAVQKAVELAKLKTYQLDWYNSQQSLVELLLNQMSVSVASHFSLPIQNLLPSSVRHVAGKLQQQPGFGALSDPQHRYALCFSCADLQ